MQNGAGMKKIKAYDELIDFIAGRSPKSSIRTFHISDDSRNRVWDLVSRVKTSELSEEETAELNDYLVLEHIIRMAKARNVVTSKRKS